MCKKFILLLLGLFPFILSAQKTDTLYTVQIVQAGWHTGIIMETANVPKETLKEIERYNSHKYLDISWGDEKFYQIPDPNIYITARSVLWPTQSVISPDAFSREIKNYYRQPTVIEITMTKEKFYTLCQTISNSFERDDKGEIIASTFYRDSSNFFLAKRKYAAFRTCNTWIAIILNKSGFDIRPFLLITANQLFRRLKKLPHSTLRI